MIEVRVRHEDDEEGVRLMDWPADRLDEIEPLLVKWSVQVNGLFCGISHASFVVANGKAYYEVTVFSDEEES